MSTHEHLILTDTQGVLPRFLSEFHRLLALGVKVLRKWEGPVWDEKKTSVVELRTPRAVIEKAAYAMANPVAAGLVRRAAQWPGVTTRLDELGRAEWTAARPDFFFDPENPMWPPHVTLKLSPLPCGEMSADDVHQAVACEVASAEAQALAESRTKRRTLGSPRALTSQSPFTRARSWEPIRGRNPTFAVGRLGQEELVACVAQVRAFRVQYRDALDAWRAGVREALFPPGTWWMSIFHGAPSVSSRDIMDAP